jgi:hypothetical protein
MIWFIFDLGIGLATFVAWVVAFFREPEAGLRARSRPWSSSETIPCSFPAGPRGRGNVVPAGSTSDLVQAIDYARNYGQNRGDFGAETEILPDLREPEPAPSEHAEPEDRGDDPSDLRMPALEGGERTLHRGPVGPVLAVPGVVLGPADEVEQPPARYRVMHEMRAGADPGLIAGIEPEIGDALDRDQSAIGDAAGKARRLCAEERGAHHRMDAIGANQDVGRDPGPFSNQASVPPPVSSRPRRR